MKISTLFPMAALALSACSDRQPAATPVSAKTAYAETKTLAAARDDLLIDGNDTISRSEFSKEDLERIRMVRELNADGPR